MLMLVQQLMTKSSRLMQCVAGTEHRVHNAFFLHVTHRFLGRGSMLVGTLNHFVPCIAGDICGTCEAVAVAPYCKDRGAPGCRHERPS